MKKKQTTTTSILYNDVICDVIWYCLFYFVQRVQIERLQTMIYNGDDENTIGENKKGKNPKLKTQNSKPQNNTNSNKTKK